MADDVLEDAGPAPDAGKAKRTPPTIDLEATKVSETSAEPNAADKTADAGPADPEAAAESRHEADPEPEPEPAKASASISPPISPWVIAPFSGAAAASLVILVGWLLGWPAVQTPPAVQAPPAAPQVSAAAVDDLGKRVASLESKLGKPATDPAVAGRLDAMEKSVAALRGDLANLRTQADKLATSLNEVKSAPPDSTAAAAPAVDLSAINQRIDQIERANRAQSAAIAQTDQKMASRPTDDLPLRRVVAAALLDVAVRHGDPFADALAAAKALAPEPDKLKPLEPFAQKGVPSPPALTRELLTLVPKLSPTAESPVGGGVLDRLQAGASKLVHVERTDATGSDRSAIVARVTAAALRNDLTDARRELASLDAADRAPAQGWLDKVAARDAALAASRQFAEDTMSGLAKSAQ